MQLRDADQSYNPLQPQLPWGPPTDEIDLLTGRLSFRPYNGGPLPPAPGRVAFLMRAGSHLTWSVDLDCLSETDQRSWARLAAAEGHIQFEFMGTQTEFPAYAQGAGFGFSNGSSHFIPGATIDRIVAHWVNLPNDLGPGTYLKHDAEDGSWCKWPGRRVIELPPWQLTIDSRCDHDEAYRDAKRSYLSVLTHTMQVERQDQQAFPADQAEQLLRDLQVGFSFPLGRWAAPLLPVGFDSHGGVVFSTWAPWFVDTPGHDADRWWPQHQRDFLDTYLTAIFAAFAKPGEREHLNFLITSAIATGQGAFLEQRLATAVSAIEYLSWVEEVLNGTKTERDWRGSGAPTRIRRLLGRAHIPLTIAPTSPALAAFAASENLVDAPAALIQVRDHVTHPKNRQALYRQGSPLADAARLASRYLDLLIMHRIQYNGFVRDRTKITGWEGPSEPVPWARHGRRRPPSTT